jgi:hypothetical protein
MKPKFSRIADNVVQGKNVKMHGFVNLYGCKIGDDSRIGAFVEIQKEALSASASRCKVTPSSAPVS